MREAEVDAVRIGFDVEGVRVRRRPSADLQDRDAARGRGHAAPCGAVPGEDQAAPMNATGPSHRPHVVTGQRIDIVEFAATDGEDGYLPGAIMTARDEWRGAGIR